MLRRPSCGAVFGGVLYQASLVTQTVKNLPAMLETWVQYLGWVDPLEEFGNPLQYSCLENPHGQRSLVGYSPWGCKELDKLSTTTGRTVLYLI